LKEIYKNIEWVNRIADLAEEIVRGEIEIDDTIEPRIAIDMAIDDILQFEYKYTMLSVYSNEEDAHELLNKRLSNII